MTAVSGPGGRRAGRGTALVVIAALVAFGCADDDDPEGSGIEEGVDPASDAATEAGCDWPMWGHDPERTFAQTCESALSTATVDRLELDWSFTTEDVVTASVAVHDGTVYAGDWSGAVYALDDATGEERWRFQTDVHDRVYSGQIVAGPAVAEVEGETALFVAGGKTMYRLDAATGEERWRFDVSFFDRNDDLDTNDDVPDDERPTEIQSLAGGRRRQGGLRVRRPRHPGVARRGGGPRRRDGRRRVVLRPRRRRRAQRVRRGVVLAERGRGGRTGLRGHGQLPQLARRVGRGHRGDRRPRPRHRRAAVVVPAPRAEQRRPRLRRRPQPVHHRRAGGRGPGQQGRRLLRRRPGDRRAGVGAGGRAQRLRTGTQLLLRRLHRPDRGARRHRRRRHRRPGRRRLPLQPRPRRRHRRAALAERRGAPRLRRHGGRSTTWPSTAASTSWCGPSTSPPARRCGAATSPASWPARRPSSGTPCTPSSGCASRAPRRRPSRPACSSSPWATRAPPAPRPPRPARPPTTGRWSWRRTTGACVGSPCEFAFDFPNPPDGLTPTGTLLVTTDPFSFRLEAEGLGDPDQWVADNAPNAAEGAEVFVAALAVSVEQPFGALICTFDADGICEADTIPQLVAPATSASPSWRCPTPAPSRRWPRAPPDSSTPPRSTRPSSSSAPTPRSERCSLDPLARRACWCWPWRSPWSPPARTMGTPRRRPRRRRSTVENGAPIVFNGQGNNLDAYSSEPPFEHQRVISSAAEDPEDGLDINAQLCFFEDDGTRYLIAGEDTDQDGAGEPGWGIFEVTGEAIGELEATQVGKLTTTFTGESNPENYGCGLLSRRAHRDRRRGQPGVGTGHGAAHHLVPAVRLLRRRRTASSTSGSAPPARSSSTTTTASSSPRRWAAPRTTLGRAPLLAALPDGPDGGGWLRPHRRHRCAAGRRGRPVGCSSTRPRAWGSRRGSWPARPAGTTCRARSTGVINEYDADGAFVRTILRPPDGDLLDADGYELGSPHGLGIDPDGHPVLRRHRHRASRRAGLPEHRPGRRHRLAPPHHLRRRGEPQPPRSWPTDLDFPDGIGILVPR